MKLSIKILGILGGVTILGWVLLRVYQQNQSQYLHSLLRKEVDAVLGASGNAVSEDLAEVWSPEMLATSLASVNKVHKTWQRHQIKIRWHRLQVHSIHWPLFSQQASLQWSVQWEFSYEGHVYQRTHVFDIDMTLTGERPGKIRAVSTIPWQAFAVTPEDLLL